MTTSTPMRPQPPSMRDPRQADAELTYLGEENEAEGGTEGDDQPEQREFDTNQPNWKRRMRDSWQFSTSFVDSNYRKNWDDSIRAFNNQHPGDSRYNTETFRKRSNIFVPKTRSIIRKNEAAAAAAFFSNMDRVSVSAVNASNQEERVSAEVMQHLLQYRLTKSVKWFQLTMGAIQDAQVQGAAIAHVHWKYSMKRNVKGELVNAEDRPAVDLIPIENFRFDPSADWTDPVNSSPYLIHVFPMFALDVKQRMERPDPKGRQWKRYPDSVLLSSTSDDSTRRSRSGTTQDPSTLQRSISDYDIVWIHRHIHRWNGTDYQFYTLNSEHLLTDPEPLESTVFHGQRPYVMGVAMIESHKPIPSTMPQLVRGLQDEINEIKNSRLDNVKFVLNKGYFAKRGKNVDLPALVRNVPGRVVLMDNPAEDVIENSWPDVTASAYAEEDRNNSNFDELAGNFSAASIQMANSAREPARAMTMLQAPATVLTEYLLKTFSETFVAPVLRQLVLLEQFYETDQNILNIAGEKSKLFQKHGTDKVTDDLLDKEMTVNVNVGMGATDPVSRLQKFLVGVTSFTKISVRPPAGVNLEEVWKEIMALSGYQDGERFTLGANPEMARLQQTNTQLMQALQQLKIKMHDKSEANQVKREVARENNIVKLVTAHKEDMHQNVQMYANHLLSQEAQQQAREQAQMAAQQPQQPQQSMPPQGMR